MRYPASGKAEIIELVEQSDLPAKRTLDKPGIPRATFYRWYDRYREGGIEALADHRSRPDRVWNRIPDEVRGQIIDLALELPELSPRELAVRFTDEWKYFVSEASVYRLLKAHAASSRSDHALLTAASISSSRRFSSFPNGRRASSAHCAAFHFQRLHFHQRQQAPRHRWLFALRWPHRSGQGLAPRFQPKPAMEEADF